MRKFDLSIFMSFRSQNQRVLGGLDCSDPANWRPCELDPPEEESSEVNNDPNRGDTTIIIVQREAPSEEDDDCWRVFGQAFGIAFAGTLAFTCCCRMFWACCKGGSIVIPR